MRRSRKRSGSRSKSCRVVSLKHSVCARKASVARVAIGLSTEVGTSGRGHGRRVAQDRQSHSAEVAGECQPALTFCPVDVQADHRRAEQVTSVDKLQLQPGLKLRRFVVGYRLEPEECAVDVAAIVKRL